MLGVLVASLGLMVCVGTALSWAQGIVDNLAFVYPDWEVTARHAAATISHQELALVSH